MTRPSPIAREIAEEIVDAIPSFDEDGALFLDAKRGPLSLSADATVDAMAALIDAHLADVRSALTAAQIILTELDLATAGTVASALAQLTREEPK